MGPVPRRPSRRCRSLGKPLGSIAPYPRRAASPVPYRVPSGGQTPPAGNVPQAGICGKAPRRWRKTTIPDPAAAARADRIRRGFTADAGQLNDRWCGDITNIDTWEGWLCLATVIDIASRRVVGYALAGHLRAELVSATLANALAARGPDPGVIFHSDRGCQYNGPGCTARSATTHPPNSQNKTRSGR